MTEDPAHQRTTRMPSADPTQALPGRGALGDEGPPAAVTAFEEAAVREPTQVMPAGGGRAPQRVVYTEEYAAGDAPVADGRRSAGDAGRVPAPAGRRFTMPALVLTSVAALLVGAILALLLLPEEEPQVQLADAAAQQALVDAQGQVAERDARIAELEGQVAERDARVAELEARVAELEAAQQGDQAAADQAAADRQAALDAREAALDERDAALAEREAAVADRETQVAAREQQVAAAEAAQAGGQPEGGGDGQAAEGDGFDLPDVQLPDDLELPQVDEEQARSVFERFVDRLESLF
jgi:hypothetical protein